MRDLTTGMIMPYEVVDPSIIIIPGEVVAATATSNVGGAAKVGFKGR
jgi:hypothetical protein